VFLPFIVENFRLVSIHTDVLIVGAGPAGLTLATALRLRGLTPLIVDKEPEGAGTSRAAVIHARTLEVLESLEVVESLLREGVRVPTFAVRDRDRRLVAIDFDSIPSRYNFTLMCPQDRTESILNRRLNSLGGHVQRGSELTGLVEHPDGVEVSIRSASGSQTVTARWLVACDGMHSRVRGSTGIAFNGAPYEESFVLADVKLQWPIGRQEVSLFFSSKGLVVVAPLPNDHFRVVATADEAPAQPSLQFVQTLLDERGPTQNAGRVLSCAWSGRFRVHHKVAADFRKGQVLLCGDAAHVHSPAGGQGMNIGIQDSVSLAEALTKDLAQTDKSAIDCWAVERRKAARDVVALTDRLTRAATLKSGFARRIRNEAFSILGTVPSLRRSLARTLAEVNPR
jgi:2-polyprenyl-6-methoxyphenol hydroxylase-like FAD-dependent oxidoreductase